MSTKGNLLYKKAKKIIPSGTMLFSKRPENYLPDYWPTYYSKAKGLYLWDLNNKKHLDFYFGVGQNILGYANNEIDKEVINACKKGNMTSMICPEEVLLAEELLKFNKWAGMVKFARSGGESSQIAIRIARAYCNKENIAVCGYHGWHDWYLSLNATDGKNFSNFLFGGFENKGVSKKLNNTVYGFKYNDFNSLSKIIKNKKIGIIIMEVSREVRPKKNFLTKIRKICNEKKIVLIFDECTSGFRASYGGIHKLYNINPDILIYGKALGNGYPITAIIGKKKIMREAKNTFISSTFWTERSGYVAALKTLQIMKKTKSWIKIKNIGKKIKKLWFDTAKKNNIDIKISGIESIPSFKFNYKNHLIYKTLLSQEMLRHNIIATNTGFVSVLHERIFKSKYPDILNNVFEKVKKIEKNKNIKVYLKSKVCESGFKRLTDK